MAWEFDNNTALQNDNEPQWELEGTKPVTQSVMDDRDGQVYNVPLAFDGIDTRFAIDTQHKGADKGSFFGKVDVTTDNPFEAALTQIGENSYEKLVDGIEEVSEKLKTSARTVVSHVGNLVDTAIVDVTRLRDKQYEAEHGYSRYPSFFFGSDETQEEIKASAQEAVANIEKIRKNTSDWFKTKQENIKKEETFDDVDTFVAGVTDAALSIAEAVGATLVTKDPKTAAYYVANLFGSMRKNEVMDTALEKGIDFDKADLISTGAGVIEGGLEIVGGLALARVAKLKSIVDIKDRVMDLALVKMAKSKLGKQAGNKLISRHTDSVWAQAYKGALVDGVEEGTQTSSGMIYENLTGLANYDSEEIINNTLFSIAVGGITGGATGGAGTAYSNRLIKQTNDRLKTLLKQDTPELTDQELQVTADAVQEMLFQESANYIGELNNVLSKEANADISELRQEGLTPEQLTAETRKLLKEKYQMNDEDINKTIQSALSVIDARNQFNEAYTIFSEGLTNAGRDAARADGEARILAARALAVARAQGTQVKDVLDRWNLQFRQTTWNEADVDGASENAMFQFPAEVYKDGKADIETEEFKKWSNDSYVVDIDVFKPDLDLTEKGITLRLFHGTDKGGFNAFSKSEVGSNTGNAGNGFWGGAYNIAKTYSESTDEFTEENQTDETRSGIYEMYMTLRNPQVWDFQGASWDGIAYDRFAIYNEEDYGWEMDEETGKYLLFDSREEAEAYLEEKGITDYKDGDSIMDRDRETKYSISRNPELFLRTGEIAQEAEENGFDGIIIQNIQDGGRHRYSDEEGTIAVAFEPNQLKSVYNKGSFSLDTDNIYYQPSSTNPNKKLSLRRSDGTDIEAEYYLQNISNVQAYNIRELKLGTKVDKNTKKKDISKAILGEKDKIYSKNIATGIEASITNNNIKEMISDIFKDKDRGYEGLKKEIVANVENIFANAVPILKHQELKNKELFDKQTIHRFALPVQIGKANFFVMITVKERTDAQEAQIDEFSIYSLRSNIRNAVDSSSMPEENTEQSQYQPHTYSINELTNFVNQNLAKYQPDDRTYYQGGVNENIYKATNSNEEPVANPANFNVFIEGSRVTDNDEPVSPTNPPKKIYRGDTRYFEEYEEQENAYEYDWGRAFYLSDNYDDILTNYQSGGADLKNRIDREAEQLANEEDIDYDEAREKVRQKYEQEDLVREFYLSIKEPVIIGGDKETFFDYTEEYDEETDEYGEPEGKGFELIGAIENYLYDIGADDYVQTIVGTLQQEMIDNGGLTASQVEDTIRGIEEVNYLIDYESGAGELLSSAFGAIGFDGIIDHRAGTKFRNMNMDPDTTHYIVFNSEQAKSVDNKGEWGVRNRNFYYQFAGPNAKTAALDQLKKAKQLEKSGVNNEEIRQQTGWFKGLDDKWRFEISDKDADFNNGYNPDEWKKNGVVFNGLTFKLGKILKHDRLFEAYPQLKDVVVEYTRRLSDGALGNFTPSENKIYIDSTMSADKIKDVLLHEIQHAIQETEGFARGGSEESAVEALRAKIMRTENSSDMGEFLSWIDEYELLNDVSTIIRLSENPESLTKTYWFYERFLGTPKNKKDRKQFLDEKGQEFLDFMREKYQGWGEKTYRYREYLQKDKSEIDKMRKSASQKVDRLHKKVYSKGYLKAKDLITKFQDHEISAYTLYKRLYGEIEARNTQARADMTDEERRATPIEETQDIKNADAIIMFGNGVAVAYEPASQEQKQAPRGAYRNSIIYLFENADASTVIHELGHFFLDDMQKFADNETTKAQLEAIYKYVGSTDGNLTPEQHEYFANSFEVYLLEGRAPNKTLEKVFFNFRKWISRIWSEIKRLSGINLTPEIRKVFDEMLGGRGLDFAMQMSGARMAEALESGTIPPNVIAKAIELLETGKMSRADMDDLIARMKTGDLKRKDFNQELKKFETGNVKHNERLNPFDKVKYKEALARGNFSKKDVLEKINRLLKWTEPRSQNGKVVGRFSNLKMNQEFDHIRELMNMEKAQAKEKLDENIKLINAMIRGEETGDMDRLVFDNKILTIRLNKANASLLLDVYNAISDSYNMGRLTTAVTGEARRARKNRLVNEAVHVLTADGDIDWRRERGKLKQFVNQLGTSQMSWQGILDILSMNDKTSKTGQSLLVQNLDVFDAQQKEAEGLAEDGEKASRFMEKKLKGVGNAAISVSRYVNSKLDEKFTIQWGANKKTFTKDQLLDIYMKSKDEETKKMMAEDTILQYNDRFLSEVNEILTAEDRAIAEALFEFYDDNYAKINAFYEEKYGTSLGKRAFYSPRSMDRGGINVDSGDLSSYAGFSGVKERKAKAGAVKIKGAFQVLQDYIVNSNHWIAWSDKLIDINAVMGDVEVKNIIRNLFGEGMEKRIGYEVSRMASNDKFQSKFGYGKLFNKIRSNYAIAALAAKPSLMIKQLTSFPAYWEHMSTAEFMSGLADFAIHMKEAVETLGNTTLMKTRDVNIIKDFEELSKSELFKKNANKVKLRELLMANIKLGDRGAIYMGGWALYKAELKKNLAKGMSEEKAKALALEKFERVTDETQQSGRLSQQSYWQSNPFLRAFTMFQSSQNQYLRKEINAIRGLVTGRMDKKQALKTLFIFHVLLPCFFQYASDGFDWDEKAQLRAALLGSLNGIFILNGVLERGLDYALGTADAWKATSTGLSDVLPFWGSGEDLAKFFIDLAEGDIDLEDYVEVVRAFGKPLGELTGIPVKYPLDVIQNFGSYAEEGEVKKEVLLWLGWSPYALRDKEED